MHDLDTRTAVFELKDKGHGIHAIARALKISRNSVRDILRSKQSVGWRTAMIIPEVEGEISALRLLRKDVLALASLEEGLEDLVLQRDNLLADASSQTRQVRELEAAIAGSLGRRAAMQRRISAALNPFWGSLFKEGKAVSRFGGQVEDFACIYTSRVSNFLHYPVERFFAKPPEMMPHERWAALGA